MSSGSSAVSRNLVDELSLDPAGVHREWRAIRRGERWVVDDHAVESQRGRDAVDLELG